MEPSPRILRKSLLAGARQAQGVAVVIDVMRAFTSAALMIHLGARKIVLLADAEAAVKLKQEEGYLAVGEVDGKKAAGFDLGNSPSHILAVGTGLFAGRSVAQRTSAGTKGAVAAAQRADGVLLGSYVTAGATARYIHRLAPPPAVVSLVAMGDDGLVATPDDEACADYLEHLLAGRPYDRVGSLRRVVDHECTRKFLRGDQDHYPAADVLYCLQPDLFDFVLSATVEHGLLVARRIDVPEDHTA
jgi:2-phosphosulfolactate phosphatase